MPGDDPVANLGGSAAGQAASQAGTAAQLRKTLLFTGTTVVPADSTLTPGSLVVWLDATPGATKAMFKAKDSGGTVRTGSVALT